MADSLGVRQKRGEAALRDAITLGNRGLVKLAVLEVRDILKQ